MTAGPLCRTLPTARLSFGGDKLKLRQGENRRHAALVDIEDYADAVEPGSSDESQRRMIGGRYPELSLKEARE